MKTFSIIFYLTVFLIGILIYLSGKHLDDQELVLSGILITIIALHLKPKED